MNNKLPAYIGKLRISFFLFDSFKKIVKSAGYKVNKQEVERLYQSDRLPKVSLNDELDMFYEKCLQNNTCSEFVYFFQTKMMTLDRQSLIKEQLAQMRRQFAEQTKKNWIDFQTKLAERNCTFQYSLETRLGDSTEFITSELQRLNHYHTHRARMRHNYNETQHRIDTVLKFTLKKTDELEYNLFNGFRATVEFDFERGKPSQENIAKSINLLNSKVIQISSSFDKWFHEMMTSMVKDVNV